MHAAGELRDGLIWNKGQEDFAAVVRAKVQGLVRLEEATRAEGLEWLVLFSSTAGLLGNAGQSDYAYANAYLDAYAQEREGRRKGGQHQGRTVSINWPLWQEGGMKAGEEAIRFQAQMLGTRPLGTNEGWTAFQHALGSGEAQCAVFFGLRSKLQTLFERKRASHDAGVPPALPVDAEAHEAALLADLKRLVSKVLRLDPAVLESDTDMSEYGFDSITFTSLAGEVNAAFGLEITPAALFEYTTLQAFAGHLLDKHGDKLAARYATQLEKLAPDKSTVSTTVPVPLRFEPGAANRELAEAFPKRTGEPIAIVGMSGIFPGSPDLETFWKNLDEGKDLITKAPAERWNFSDSLPARAASSPPLENPWGGFVADIDKFDPLFFDISPREAELMDPQQRLFLQTVWKAIEDAGHKKSDLAGTRTGLFVGVAANDYASLLAIGGVEVEAYSSTGNAHSVLANRVSYFFDLRGPSEAIDTACSSALVAIHRAIESIESGSSEMAIVGGVNVLLSPGAFLAFAKAGMLSADGRCKTFDERANGYVRGEGFGALLLKPLSRAQSDGDHIYAIISGSAENHGGHVQSLTVPNPNAQAQLLQAAFARAGIDPYTIGYIEAHGTGTSLGDPIEINGLKKAFGENRGAVPHPSCAVGSVKTNIGHLETAAGIAGIIKVLLAMRHQRIPGNVHLQRLNPYIQLDGSPFCFPQASKPWDVLHDRDGRSLPRRAGVSSFGFGGANAHVVLEEYAEARPASAADETGGAELIILSARDELRLREMGTQLVRWLEGRPAAGLRSIAYTLQVGREPMDERLALLASSVDELLEKLRQFLSGDKTIAGFHRGNAIENKAGLALLRQIHERDEFVQPLLKDRNLPKLAQLWVSGVEIGWWGLWVGETVRRVSLPGYAFARERYWVPVAAPAAAARGGTGRLHALAPRNESTLAEQVYENREKIQTRLLDRHVHPDGEKSVAAVQASATSKGRVVEYLIGQFAALIKLPVGRIKAHEPLERFGLDSIMAVEFSQQLEKDFGELSKTLLFEYQNLDALADYFLSRHGERCANFGNGKVAADTSSGSLGAANSALVRGPEKASKPERFLDISKPGTMRDDVAIIGVFGRYPMAENPEEFWANLVAGKDCIEEIPGERWDYRLYYAPAPGKPGTSSNKWGGFIRKFDRFDPLFFNISPREAEIMDPQERLFLETVWNTVEDAGYSKSALSGKKVGVFVGVMYGQYQLFGVEESLRRGEVVTFNSSYASIANRVSYFFNWQGASVALDTMCSSALMSIHLACESLKRGESELAVAGGVNVILHPHKDVGLSQAGFLNPEGKCRSFGKSDARGYVPGEGVGAVLLKPLSQALRDRDQIHGVIKATAVNHGGKTNGYTVPNPNAQADLVSSGLKQAGLDPRTISYVEAAATGSALGDAVEVAGLAKAFQLSTPDSQFCAVGSVKANIGHLESASGIAGLTKVLLQMKHQKLVPSIHAAELNPGIRWAETPFFVQRELVEWKRPVVAGQAQPRRACVNAFGAGGSNAHLIVEEFADASARSDATPRDVSVLIVLSARNAARLRERAAELAGYLRRTQTDPASRPRLIDVAYTLQAGREPMEERLAFVAVSLEETAEKLEAFVGGDRSAEGLNSASGVEAETPNDALARNGFELGGPSDVAAKSDFEKVAQLWVTGVTIDWERLSGGSRPRRISLPTYPFARERYWFRESVAEPEPSGGKRAHQTPTPALGTPGNGAPSAAIAEELRQMLGAALKLAPARIGLRKRMVDYGLDSVTTVAFQGMIERAFKLRLSSGLIAEHPSLEALARHLCEHHADAFRSEPGQPTDGGTNPDASQTASDLVLSVSLSEAGGSGPSRWAPTLVTSAASRTPSPRKRRRAVALAPMDYLFVGPQRFAIQVLYHFQRPLDFGDLRRGLQRAGEAFYPVNAQLIRRHENEYVIRECHDAVDFREVICEPGSVLPQQDCPASFKPFQVDFDPAVPGEKLAKFRLFQVAGGSVLSANVSHAVADGYSFYYFMSAWASACRGVPFPPPDHSRNVVNRLVRRYLANLASVRAGSRPEPESRPPWSQPAFEPTTSRVETLAFEPESILAEIRAQAGTRTRDKLTENSVLTALVWKSYAQALSSQTTDLVLACPIDFRRICAKLSPAFFGNAAAPALTRCSRERVLNEPVAALAAMIFDSIRACDEQIFIEYYANLDRLRTTGGLEAVERMRLVDPGNGLIVTNVSKFPHDPIDFGNGPFTQEFTPVNYTGTAVIVSGPDGMVKVRLAYPELVAT
ncbi:MAG: beta-ketoacyl synthase N-terminal-like domain-containing protein [Limisphaerales bacterium]